MSEDRAGAVIPGTARSAMFAAFFLSGACGLAYEVVWTRLISREVGHTSFALATVLAAFMGGLALGSAIAGRLVARMRNPLAGYGLLEIGIGASALAVPWLLRLFHPALASLYCAESMHGLPYQAARFGVCALVLLVPTTCMGATLPLLSEPLVRRREELGGTLGWLYASNTFGAVAGALAAGFVLLPGWGMRFTMSTAAAANVVVGLVALAASRSAVPLAAPSQTGPDLRGSPIYLWGMLLSGAFAMANQVVWTRFLSLQIGTSAYAFTIIVSSFILGMAVGSMFFGRRVDRSKDPMATFGFLQVCIGFFSLVLYILFGILAMTIDGIVKEHHYSFPTLMALFFGAVFSIVFLPTFFLGGTFPVAVKGYVPEGTRTGPAVGRVYAWNTMGAILGSFAGGFLVVPNLGVWHAILWLAVGNVALGAIVLLRSKSRLAWLKAAASLIVAGTVAVRMPTGSESLLIQGRYVYAVWADVTGGGPDWTSPLDPEFSVDEAICCYKDGASASVSVIAMANDTRSLRINGSVQASSRGDLATQILVAQLSLLTHPGPVRDVLCVGVGSGVTAGSATVEPGVRLDAVEISAEVVEAADQYFWRESHDLCRNPDVARVLVEDARSHIAYTDRRYDVIINEPSHVFICGMGDVFTQEYFEACRARLTKGGVMSQWVQAYWHSPEDVRTIIATFVRVFPKAWLWEVLPGSDYVLVGAGEDLDFAAVSSRWVGPVKEEMARIDLLRPAQLFGGVVADPDGLAEYVRGARLMRDDSVHLEYTAPHELYGGRGFSALDDINRLRERTPATAGWPEGGTACREARKRAIVIKEDRGRAAEGRIEDALALAELDPWAGVLARRVSLSASLTGDGEITRLLARFPGEVEIVIRAAEVAHRSGNREEADKLLAEAASRFPAAAQPCFERARLLKELGRTREADEEQERAWERWRAIKKGRP